jgi:hypothetical protein
MKQIMFTNHQPKIKAYAIKNGDNFFKVIQFVLLTIQQPLHSIPFQMTLVDSEGLAANCLWGVKREAWLWHKKNKNFVYDHAMLLDHIHVNPGHAASELLIYFASLPGLGLAKGGFLAQLTFGLVGCLDSHNVERYGLAKSQVSASAFKRAKTPTTRHAKVNQYLDLCLELGGCEGLWNSWCEYVYTKQAHQGYYNSAHHVSELHCTALGIGGSSL